MTLDEKNSIRILSHRILDFLKQSGCSNKYIGIGYMIYHYMFMMLGAFIILFNNNILHLFYTLLFVSVDSFAIVVLHNCPLTHLEEKYLNTNVVEERSNFFKKCNILYSCEHQYEKQIELLINISLFIVFKCLLLIAFNTFHIKLHNTNNLYV
jgi:hypothetical protein